MGALDTRSRAMLEHVLTVLDGNDLKVKIELVTENFSRRSVAISWASRSPAHLQGGFRRAAGANRLLRYAGG